ncbi:MAG TPA: site-specific integrase [Verrucomicrobiae bacterium]|nr:site-specific integrase [Verrucomicrobiae bacterium]
MRLREAVLRWRDLANIGRKPKTQKYHAEIAGIILARLRTNKALEAINQIDLSEFVLEIAHYCPTRFNAVVGAIKKILPQARFIPRRPVTIRERYTLNQDEFSLLLAECDRRPRSHVGLIVRFLSHTGLRIGAARQLKWSDVQADGIKVPGSIQKNGKVCIVPFVNGTIEILSRLKAITGDGEFILPQKECKRSLDSACRCAGLPHLSHHDFRHLFATRCIESGVDVPTAARWLGHRDGGALLSKVYFHLLNPHSRAMAAKVRIDSGQTK